MLIIPTVDTGPHFERGAGQVNDPNPSDRMSHISNEALGLLSVTGVGKSITAVINSEVAALEASGWCRKPWCSDSNGRPRLWD